MNDAADEPSKPTSAEPEFRKISDEELERILADHKKWLEAEDKTGLDHLRADLSRADLRGQDAILRVAQLQGAILDGAQLQGANLAEAQLQGANLDRGPTAGGRPHRGPTAGASLEAQLQGANLIRPNCRRGQSLPPGPTAEAYLRGPAAGGLPLPGPTAGGHAHRRPTAGSRPLRGPTAGGQPPRGSAPRSRPQQVRTSSGWRSPRTESRDRSALLTSPMQISATPT